MDALRTALLDIVSRLGPIFGLVAFMIGSLGAIEGARETKFYPYVHAFLSRLAYLRSFLFFSRKTCRIKNLTTGAIRDSSVTAHGLFVRTSVDPPGTTWQEGSDTYVVVENIDHDLSTVFYVSVSLIFLAIIFTVGRDLLSFFAFAMHPFVKMVTVWGGLGFDWSILYVPLQSLAYLLLGLFVVYLSITLGLGCTLKSVLLFANWLSRSLTKKGYYTSLVVITIVSGALSQLEKFLK